MAQAILWFRRDLRVADNPALQTLLDEGHTPIPVYIHGEPDDDWPLGGASAWWLHHSLNALKRSLQERGSDLLVLRGDPETVLAGLLNKSGVTRLAWNRCYEPESVKRDERIKRELGKQGCEVSSHSAALLREPWTLLKKDETPYRVFTPFWKSLHGAGPGREVIAAAKRLPAFQSRGITGVLPIDALELLPAIQWDKAFYPRWTPGEDGAWQLLESFSDNDLSDYASHRDIPANAGTSHLSPHLHFGEISPVQLWQTLYNQAATTVAPGTIAATESWLRQLAWREFSHHLLYHFPHTPAQPMDDRFKGFPWRKKYANALTHWQQGRTGIPLVDAGMRELWATGYMHNRVRMIVASFLTKNLLIPWQEGARWFWDTLVDADLANNTMGWQWVAGCGVDASPYYRIFNPVLQGQKFDKDGRYTRQWVPDLAKLNNKYLHQPWSAAPAVLADAGVTLGKDYPEPMVDLQESRRQALAAWEQIRQLSRT